MSGILKHPLPLIIVQDLISMSLKVLNLMVLYMILARVLIKATGISVKSIFKSNTDNEHIVRVSSAGNISC